MSKDVFVSYSSADKDIALKVCESIETMGVDCWIAPRDVLPGMNYGKAIIQAINTCKVMVLVYSSHSDSSQQVLREVERAVSKNVFIIPIRIENVSPSEDFEYYISTTHWLDAFRPPLEEHIHKLVDTINSVLERGRSEQRKVEASPYVGDIEDHVKASLSDIESRVSTSLSGFGRKEEIKETTTCKTEAEEEVDLDVIRSSFILGNFFALYSQKGPDGGEKTEELLEAFEIMEMGDYLLDPLIEIRSNYGRAQKSKEIYKDMKENIASDHGEVTSSMFELGSSLMGITLASDEYFTGSKHTAWRNLEPMIKTAKESIKEIRCDLGEVDLAFIKKLTSSPTNNQTYVEELVAACEQTIDAMYGI
ncbi:MAG: toll/interleukin-1 receptor domain-containing protein [Thermoplasmatota archaeon]